MSVLFIGGIWHGRRIAVKSPLATFVCADETERIRDFGYSAAPKNQICTYRLRRFSFEGEIVPVYVDVTMPELQATQSIAGQLVPSGGG